MKYTPIIVDGYVSTNKDGFVHFTQREPKENGYSYIEGNTLFSAEVPEGIHRARLAIGPMSASYKHIDVTIMDGDIVLNFPLAPLNIGRMRRGWHSKKVPSILSYELTLL